MKKNIFKVIAVAAFCLSLTSCAMHHRGGRGGGHNQGPSHGEHRP